MNPTDTDSFVYRVRRELYRGPLHLGETVYAADEVVPPHTHPQPVLILLLEGEATHFCGRVARHTRPGHVVYVPEGVSHSLHFGSGISRAFSVELDSRRGQTGLPRSSFHTSAPHILRTMLLAYRALVEETCSNADVLQVTLLDSIRRFDRERRRVAECGPDAIWLVQALELVNDGAVHAVRIASIAHAVGKHPSHLSRRFRQMFGESVAAVRSRVRVEAASRALLSDASRISAIAADLGFSDHAHLTRSFQRSMRMTPMEFRRAVIDTGLSCEQRQNLHSTDEFIFRAPETAAIKVEESA